MKLLRFGDIGQEKPGVVDVDGTIRDLSAHIDDITGETLSDAGLKSLCDINISSLPVIDAAVRIGTPVTNIGKVVAIGLNYRDHAIEAGMPIPAEPIVFMKATSALCGPNDGIVIPRNSHCVDWEVELAVIIGKKAKYVSKADALSHVAGYSVMNDVSERHFQLEKGGQWVKGKSADSFAPLGPWLVTKDEVADPQELNLWLEVDGKSYQNGNSDQMIFTVADIISYLSDHMTLLPGDVIITGTPPGVGMGFKPPVYLQEGQIVTLGVEGLGQQTQKVYAD